MKFKVIAILMCLVMLIALIMPLNRGFARITANIYLRKLGDSDKFSYKMTEYSTHQDAYMIYYEDRLGNTRVIAVGSRLFPFHVEYDSFIQKG